MAKKSSPVTSVALARRIFPRLGLSGKINKGVFDGGWSGSGKLLASYSPIDGRLLAQIRTATPEEYERALQRAAAAFQNWRTVPAPVRGEVIRQLGNALRDAKDDLGALITLEAGKITAEGQGEVQEMIDICDFATGLSRQLYGLTTGDMSKTGTLGLGEDIQKYGEEMKSTGLKAREAERGRKVAAAQVGVAA